MILSLIIGLSVFFTVLGLELIRIGFGLPALFIAAVISIPTVSTLIVLVLQRYAQSKDNYSDDWNDWIDNNPDWREYETV